MRGGDRWDRPAPEYGRRLRIAAGRLARVPDGAPLLESEPVTNALAPAPGLVRGRFQAWFGIPGGSWRCAKGPRARERPWSLRAAPPAEHSMPWPRRCAVLGAGPVFIAAYADRLDAHRVDTLHNAAPHPELRAPLLAKTDDVRRVSSCEDARGLKPRTSSRNDGTRRKFIMRLSSRPHRPGGGAGLRAASALAIDSGGGPRPRSPPRAGAGEEARPGGRVRLAAAGRAYRGAPRKWRVIAY